MSLDPTDDNPVAKVGLERLLRAEVASGERLLWSGMPRQGMFLRGSDLFAIPFSLLWGGFAIFWESTVWATGAPLLFKLWGVPFVLVGLYMIFGRFIVDSMIRARTYYGVTDQTIIIISGFRSRRVQTLPLSRTATISLSEKTGGKGTVTFGSNPIPFAFNPFGAAWPGTARRLAPVFDQIDGARAVYDLIRQAQKDDTSLKTWEWSDG